MNSYRSKNWEAQFIRNCPLSSTVVLGGFFLNEKADANPQWEWSNLENKWYLNWTIFSSGTTANQRQSADLNRQEKHFVSHFYK